LILNFSGIWVLISLDVYAGGQNFRGVFDLLFDIWIEFGCSNSNFEYALVNHR
jgi:hypothetical protein